jgi:hypothetical protein
MARTAMYLGVVWLLDGFRIAFIDILYTQLVTTIN